MRVVAKIGTASITTEDGNVNREAIIALCGGVASLRSEGHEVVVVSSGAVAAGVPAVGLSERPSDMETLQAVSAVGQARLMEVYNEVLAGHGLVGAQVLLDPHDFVDRTQYLHARRTLSRLIELGCVPIVNENDAIASSELRYGDNDRLAALLAHNLSADVLVLLTDLDGLHTADPRVDPQAPLVDRVAADDPLLAISTSMSGSGRGSGGMASKLEAARIASWSGVRTVIARAARDSVLVDAVHGSAVGTTFDAHDRRLPARKLWIAFAAEVAGRITVDAGARNAVATRSTSLLPAGVVAVDGNFDEGSTVEVADDEGSVFARGMVAVSAADLRGVIGRRTGDLPEGMTHEVIHRDDLVVLPS
ncbi:MAG: glutamate 5-kinase [Ilumatobacteraceae bacterium]